MSTNGPIACSSGTYQVVCTKLLLAQWLKLCYFIFIGLVVKAHQSRLLDTNRRLAREILVEKLDQVQNGEESVASQKKRIEERKSGKNDAKRRKLQDLKAAWKERENEP
jgi:hypothetical protein